MIAAKPSARAPRVDYRALADFRYEIRRFLRVSEDAAREAGMEPQQHQLLLALAGAPPDAEPTVAYLAERMQLQHHSVVGLIDRLEARRLVERRRDPADHRRAMVSLTPAGKAILFKLSITHQEELRSRAAMVVKAMAAIVRTTSPRR
jgi:DNA-binding MarR family transcriptional regulator